MNFLKYQFSKVLKKLVSTSMEIELTDNRESVMNKMVQKFIHNGFIK